MHGYKCWELYRGSINLIDYSSESIFSFDEMGSVAWTNCNDSVNTTIDFWVEKNCENQNEWKYIVNIFKIKSMGIFDLWSIPGAICNIGGTFAEIVKKIHDDYQSDKTQEVSQEKNTDNKTPNKANKK